MREDKGEAQVYLDKKKYSGCYCKVYRMKDGLIGFYQDGYTDVTGTFRYAQSNL